MTVYKTHIDGVLTLLKPEDRLPLVVDSPHSGRLYPDDFDFACAKTELVRAEDNHLDWLLQSAPKHGASSLFFECPRTYIDPNRALDDLDPEMIIGDWSGPVHPTARSHYGVGLLRRLIRPGVPLYNRKLGIEEVRHRIDHYYRPYHETLENELDDLYDRFGQVWHLNMHSMPKQSARTQNGRPVDFVLGDLYGKSCRRDFVHALKRHLEGEGYRVALNDPYPGVELIDAYSNPAMGRHAVQVEMSKAMYWDPLHNCFNAHVAKLEQTLDRMFSFCADFIEKDLVPLAAD